MRGIVRIGYTLGDLVVYAKNKKEFLAKELGIEEIPSKATFARVLSAINGQEIGNAILDILRMRFGVSGKVIAVDGKAICSTSKPDNPHSALQILSAYMTDKRRRPGPGSNSREDERDPCIPGNAHLPGCCGQNGHC